MTTLSSSDKSANITLSNVNLTATWNASAGGARSTTSQSGGKFYFEATHNVVRVVAGVGLANAAYPIASSFTNTAGTIYARFEAVTIQGNGTNLGSSNNFPSAGQVASFAVDLTAALFWTRVQGGNWNNSATNNPATAVGGISFSYLTGPFFVLAGGAAGTAGEQSTVNFGPGGFAFAIPAGFQAWDAAAGATQARAMVLA